MKITKEQALAGGVKEGSDLWNKLFGPQQYSISAKVSEKGAVSVYGLQRFPVTLYANQWEAVLNNADSLRKFIADNRAQLAEKSA